ncbi:hypothetical protein [Pseudomonas syringae]|uniref:hypothetical protein n=1 Tax=Pseudomonas syringae TaxID=317 RepID=UPI003F753D19
MAHKKTGIKGVYDKAVYLRQRQQMVQWYADYLDSLENGMTSELEDNFRSIAKGMAR